MSSRCCTSCIYECMPTTSYVCQNCIEEHSHYVFDSIERRSNMYECFHCGNKTVIWSCDYDPEDMGYEGTGVIHICHCASCGAEIEYRVLDKEE